MYRQRDLGVFSALIIPLVNTAVWLMVRLAMSNLIDGMSA